MTDGGRSASIERRPPDWAALAIALFFIALAAIVAWDAAHMRAGAGGYSRIGPRAFPYGVAVGLAAIGVLTALVGFRTAAPPREREEIAPLAWIIGGLVAQIVLLPLAGFSIATGAVFAATAAAFGRRRIWITYPFGVAFSLLVWLFFSEALRLVLPRGALERGAADVVDWLFTAGSSAP
jgi:putative tricarboxylic transport membrane protein